MSGSLPRPDPLLLAVIGLGAAVAALVLVFVVWTGQRRLLRRYRRLLFGPKEATLEGILLEQATTIETLHQRLSQLENAVEILGQSVVSHVQHVGIVRFKAFPEAGGDLSFSIALLDGTRTGIVITSLHGRQETMIYAKPVVNGGSTYALSDEEKSAIAKSIGKTS